jgi:hypothetical protein
MIRHALRDEICPILIEEALTLELQGNNCYVSTGENSGTRRVKSNNPVAGVPLWLARFQGIVETGPGWPIKYQ